MNPGVFLSYYPTYNILDTIISDGNYNGMNIFLDLKNAFQSLYMKHNVEYLVEIGKRSKFLDTSIFSSFLSFLSFHKKYSLKRGKRIKFYVFFDSGKSVFHKDISKKYKISRSIDDLFGLDREQRGLFFDILQKNLILIEKAGNRIPDVKVIRLENLDSDFVPFFLIKNNLVDNSYCNVIYSNDKDMLQILSLGSNVYQFKKTQNKKTIVYPKEASTEYFKDHTMIYPDSYIPLIMAIVGDSGDDIDGIPGIGGKRIIPLLEQLETFIDIEHLYENIRNGRSILKDNCQDKIENKYIEKIILSEINDGIISKNIKLISFEFLEDQIRNPSTTEMLKRKQYIQDIITKDKSVEFSILMNALLKNQIEFVLEDLASLFEETPFNA